MFYWFISCCSVVLCLGFCIVCLVLLRVIDLLVGLLVWCFVGVGLWVLLFGFGWCWFVDTLWFGLMALICVGYYFGMVWLVCLGVCYMLFSVSC